MSLTLEKVQTMFPQASVEEVSCYSLDHPLWSLAVLVGELGAPFRCSTGQYTVDQNKDNKIDYYVEMNPQLNILAITYPK